jgi:hypothetical protein
LAALALPPAAESSHEASGDRAGEAVREQQPSEQVFGVRSLLLSGSASTQGFSDDIEIPV